MMEVNGSKHEVSKQPNECLTHVIDGHVIQESSQPFPLDDDSKGRNRKEPEIKATNAPATTTPSLLGRPTVPPPIVTTPTSKQDSNEKKRGPGRPSGSTKQKIEQQRLLQQQHQQIQQLESSDIHKVNKDNGPLNKKAKLDFEAGPPTLSAATTAPPPPTSGTTPESQQKPKLNIDVIKNNPLKWNVTQVCDFVKNLPGCSDYVEDFQLQEIDGQALMLLKADHLMSAMAIKLGPALKICNAIEAMREELKQN